MNSLKNRSIPFSFVLITAFFFACSSAKETDQTFSQDDLVQAINNNRWTFTANNASPSYGNTRNLTAGYFITLKNDTLLSALPYYGKLNSPAGALSGNPLDFRSTEFTLSKEDKKPGEWIVTINRPDREVQSLMFTLFDNGSAQLNVIMTNRTGISFSGRVAPVNSR
jgi:hypothetical protein